VSLIPPATFDLLSTARPKAPYPGLRPFEAEEWSIFFGREQMIDDVIDRLATHCLVLIHGASGSGKSSLVRAGVLPLLAGQYLRVGAPWRTFSIRPSGGPLWNLAKEFARLEGRADDLTRIDEIVGAFSARDATLSSVFASSAAASGVAAPDERLCVLVDQFEELFRFEKETSREEAELFVDLLVRNDTVPDEASDKTPKETGDRQNGARAARVHVIVTMRSEYLGECARFKGLAEAINRTQYLVPGMDRDSLLRAILRPAQVYGGEVASELAEKLVAEAGGREDELPLIQHGLMFLWNAAAARAKPGERVVLDSEPLEAAGGLVRLLSDHADAVASVAAADPAHRDILERLFRALTDMNVEGKAIRRPQAFRDLVAVTQSEPDTLRGIIEAFRRDGVSFVTPYGDQPIADNTVIDISHEALIRCWDKLADPGSGWLTHEFNDGLIWRSLLVEAEGFAADKRRVLSPATTAERWKWWQHRHVNAAWAQRYGDSFPLVRKLIDASRRHSRHIRQLQAAAIVVSLLIGFAGAAYWVSQNQTRLQMVADLYLWHTPLSAQGEGALKPKQEFQDCGRCPRMVVVPAGIFMMGSPAEKGADDEHPQHSVTIARPFAIGKFEITFDEFDTCAELGGGCTRPYDYGWGRGDRPVVSVSWDDAQKYLSWLSRETGKQYRLLSEAEYEYAARAGKETAYPWGDAVKLDGKAMANCSDCASSWDDRQTAPVGRFTANGLGLYDMVGNVWEWVEDCYHPSYEIDASPSKVEAPANGLPWTDSQCQERVVRGGSWDYDPQYLRSAVRDRNSSFYQGSDLGFRIARTLAAP
jgi:formylglycine-generating enzyme required for sulfatase activity/energy-coupling factor transporter ATP-binding protein EcfA2